MKSKPSHPPASAPRAVAGKAVSASRRSAKSHPVEKAGTAGSAMSQDRFTILLVEDHPSTRIGIQRLLEISGYQVLAAASGAEALAIASTHSLDFVISDLGLPDQTGHELMTQLRQLHGLRGIALTGRDADGEMERSLQAGFHEYLTKPVDFEQLKEVITDFFRLQK